MSGSSSPAPSDTAHAPSGPAHAPSDTAAAVTLSARAVSVDLAGRRVVEAVDFDAHASELSAIIGPNAAGKTTLVKALLGLVPHAGAVLHQGVPLSALDPAERARRIAYVPQRSELRAHLSVREVVALARYAGRAGIFRLRQADVLAVDHALERVGAARLAARDYLELSGGEQRLVLLGRALASGARTIVLDEPTLSLDVRHALVLFELLRGLVAEGYCVVCVLHDLDEVLRFADRVLLLERGRARFSGSGKDPAFTSAAEAVYGVRLVAHDRLGFRLPPDARAELDARPLRSVEAP